jgi:sulfinoalanine decarboxylase
MDEEPSTFREDLKLFNTLVEYLLNEEKDQPVAERVDSDDLDKTVDYSLNPLPLLDSQLIDKLKSLIVTTPKTATSLFFNQLFGGRQSKAVLGDLLAVLLNNSMYTYKVAGPQVAIEKEIINRSCELIGYDEHSDGTLPPGGSMSNFMAVIMARDKVEPNARFAGIKKPLVMYTSKESHYSNAKNASFSGLGRDQVRYINTNERGEMLTSELRQTVENDIKDGKIPFYVNATAGTTVLGAFDPFEEIADMCEEFDMWMHVDGAYCGATIFSEKYKYLLAGADRSDSFSYNAHKMLGTPLTCSLILVKDRKYLKHSFANKADYLYQTDDGEYDLGQTSIQCGRRNDALKYWTLWKSVGTNGLGSIVDKQYELANYALDYINNHPDYKVYSFEKSISVCFNYKDIDPEILCTALYEEGITLVGFGSFQGETFVRFVTINPSNDEEDILRFFNKLETFAEATPALLNTYSEVDA